MTNDALDAEAAKQSRTFADIAFLTSAASRLRELEGALAFAEAELARSRAWSAGRAADIVTLGAALGAALSQVEAQDADDRCSEAEGMSHTLEELEAIARGATQGPWSELHNTSGPLGVVALREPLDASKRVCWLEMPGEHSNAKHISTFDPPTCLSLLARVRELEGALKPWQANTPTGLEAAVAEFKAALPGWWYSVCECQMSCDASCAPTIDSPHIALVEHGNPFDSGFHADLKQPSSLAAALRDVMEQALAALSTEEEAS